MSLDIVLTRNGLMALGWAKAAAGAWFAGRSGVPVADLLVDDHVDIAERIRLAVVLMGDLRRRRYARDCVERAFEGERGQGRDPGMIAQDALDWATDETATPEELAEALDGVKHLPADAARRAVSNRHLGAMGHRQACSRSAARTTARGALAAMAGDADTAAREAVTAIAAQASEEIATDEPDAWSDASIAIVSAAGVQAWGAERRWQLARAVETLRSKEG